MGQWGKKMEDFLAAFVDILGKGKILSGYYRNPFIKKQMQIMTDSLGNNLDFQISTSKYVVLKLGQQ